ncbi:coiled-coil domain-containing protein 112-like [Branchiostoma floridae x Branchiostoma belcheri]
MTGIFFKMAAAGVGKVLNGTDKAGKDKDVWVWKTRTEKARKTEVLREIDQLELKIKNLEREKTTHLYSKRSDFRQQFCELEELEMKGNTNRKTEKVKLRQQLDKMRGMVKKFHIQLKDVKPTPEFLEKLKVTMEEIETTISAFKDQRRVDYEALLRDERTLTQEITALEKKIDAWAQGPAGVAMETKGAKAKNLSLKNNVMKDLPPEVAAFERFLAQTGGHQGGWDDYDHQAFLKTRSKFRGKAAFLDEAVRACPGRTIGDVRQHESWYQEYTTLKERKKEAIANWRKKKESEKEELLQQADEDSSSDDEEMLTARSKQIEQEREEKKKRLNAWKVQKELQRAQEEERKLKEELSKAKHQEKERERQAAVRAQVEQYRRQRQEEEEVLRREQEEQYRQDRVRKQMAVAEEMSRFQERDQRMVEEKLAKDRAREEAVKEKNKRLEKLKGQVEVKVERDPSRLYKPTALWKQRNKEIGATGGGRVLHMTHRAVPNWRQGV